MENLNQVLPPQVDKDSPLATVVIPIYNAKPFIAECLQSVLNQCEIPLSSIELCMFDDSSTDGSSEIVLRYLPVLRAALHSVHLSRGTDGPNGVGGARNRACRFASSPILVFLDADDTMHPERVARSVNVFNPLNIEKWKGDMDGDVDIIGGRFERLPQGSTPRYEEYHHRLETKDLASHAFRDAPLAMPTVACRTSVWQSVAFVEGQGVPEDLHFFYMAMKKGFRLHKLLGETLTYYRFHQSMTSLTLHRRTLLSVRVRAFEDLVLSRPEWCTGFSIWNSGRDGRHVFKSLSPHAQNLVRTWGDVAIRRVGTSLHGRPVVHFTNLVPPIVCCVALDRAGGQFEANLASLQLRPGHDYIHLI